MLKISLTCALLFFLISASLEAIESGPTAEPVVAASETTSMTGQRFSEAQLSLVSRWVLDRAPGCPPDAMIAATERFLNEMSSRNPQELDRISTGDFPQQRFESLLLRHIAGAMSGSQHAALREDLARKRLEAILAANELGSPGATLNSAELIEKIKAASQVYHRRLVEGRIEDDDLLPLIKRIRSPGETVTATKQRPTKTLSATDIVSEYGRRNQAGSAVQRLRGYSVDATLKTATGETQHLVLFRLRPDRFRLLVKAEGVTQLIVASTGRAFWQQLAGRKAIELSRASMGEKVYLGEFINPLLSDSGYAFEKLEDAVFDGIKVHRLRILRPDGTNYVSCIDLEKFREIGRENLGGLTVSYSDFREVAGVTFSFRESMKDQQGRTAVLEIQRVVPNPGLVQSYFEPSELVEPSYFALEQWLSSPAGTAAIVR